MCDFHAIVHQHTTATMHKDLTILQNDRSAWSNSVFYKPAYDNLTYFSRFTSDGNLLNIKSKEGFKTALKSSMYRQLSTSWSTYLLGRHTFRILPEWKSRIFCDSSLKEAEGYYIRCCFSQNDTRVSRKRYTANNTFLSTCPRCLDADETVEHVIMKCTALQPYRLQLFSTLRKKKVTPTLKNILTHPKIQKETLKFIYKSLHYTP